MKTAFILFISIFSLSWVEKISSLSMSPGRTYSHYKTKLNMSNKKSSKFDRALDDFIGKRYGGGEAFYGKRTSTMTDEEYAELMGTGNKENEPNDIPMKENAILIVGSLESLGQWIVYDLASKGFNVRVACSDLKKGVSLFGLPGKNVDFIELKAGSDERVYAKAIENVQAVVLCGNFDPALSIFLKESKEYCILATKLIELGKRAQTANVGEIKKLVLLSRVIDGTEKPETLSNPLALIDAFDRVESSLYNDFRSLHDDLEKIVRRSGFDYVIARAPSNILLSREPSKFDIQLCQSSKATGPRTNLIGVLDLAEAVSQSLLADASRVTFTVEEKLVIKESTNEDLPLIIKSTDAVANSAGDNSPDRPRRRSFYAILDMGDVDMQTSYMIKPKEAYLAQIEEDSKVDKYWSGLFSNLSPDA